MNDERELVRFPEENSSNFIRNNKNIYYIFWELGDLVVILYIPNITDSKTIPCSIYYMDANTDDSGSPKIKYLQRNNVRGTTALRKDTASQAHCIISGEYYQLNLGGMIHGTIHNVFEKITIRQRL